jgi:hypothetical protein
LIEGAVPDHGIEDVATASGEGDEVARLLCFAARRRLVEQPFSRPIQCNGVVLALADIAFSWGPGI